MRDRRLLVDGRNNRAIAPLRRVPGIAVHVLRDTLGQRRIGANESLGLGADQRGTYVTEQHRRQHEGRVSDRVDLISGLPSNVGEAVPVLREEIIGMLYQPMAEEWPQGDRQGTCASIITNLDKVMELAIAEPFLTPVDLSQYPSYAYIIEYPIDLSTIKARFENHFYRRITAAQFDVRYLATNAERFNQSHSVIVKHARIITDLCLRVIRYDVRKDGLDESTYRSRSRSRFQGILQHDGRERAVPSTNGRLRVVGQRDGNERRCARPVDKEQRSASVAHEELC